MSILVEAKSRFTQIKKELKGFNPLAVGLLTADAVWYAKQHGTIFEGEHFPLEGAFIATGNHFNKYDARKAHYRSFVEDLRLLTVVVRRGLIQRDAIESNEFLQRLGETRESVMAEYNPLTAWVLRGMNVVGILRDKPSMEATRRGRNTIKTGRGWAIFMQQHRQADCILRDLQPGAAYFAQEFPDTPIYPIAFSGPPVEKTDRATVLKPVTYNILKKEYGRDLTIPELTIMIADMIVTALPESSQIDWAHRWPQELDRLNKTLIRTPKRNFKTIDD